MRAMRVLALTGPGALRVDEVAEPSRRSGDAVRIAVHAAGIGFVDTLVARGKYQVRQEPPFTPGMEVSGVIVEVPDSLGSGALILHRCVSGRLSQRRCRWVVARR